MKVTPIRAADERVVPFSAEQVWPVLLDFRRVPEWWPRSLRVKVVAVTADGVGSELEIHPRGGRAFRCRAESAETAHRLVMRYPGPFIAGTGEWRLEPVPGGTRVIYTLDVVAQGRLVAWLGRWLNLGEIHSKSMRDVLENLERETARRVG